MYVIRELRKCWTRFVRFFIHWATSLIFGFVYGKPVPIPPIRNPLLLQPASQLAEKIRKKQVKSEELVKAYIDRIKEVQPIINAIVDERYDEALKEARQVDELLESNEKPEDEIAKSKPLLGVPFSCKDHIALKGMSFTAGLLSRKGIKADEDSDVVKHLKDAGAIPIVSTNLPELCMWWESSNLIYGATVNPYDTRRTCGGSSGGEGALIASCGSLFGLGSDFGGSVRIPALMNGVFGHKPSRGAVPHNGYYFPYPEEVKGNFVIGPLCRYATDLLPIMKTLTGNPEILKLDVPVSFHGMKIYYAEDSGDDPQVSPVVPEIKAAMRKALAHFEDEHNAQIKKVTLPGLTGAFETWFHVFVEGKPPRLTEVMGDFKEEVDVNKEFMKWCLGRSNHTLHSIAFASMEKNAFNFKPEDHTRAMDKFNKLKADFEEILKEDSVFFYPTLPEPAPYHHQTLFKCADLNLTSFVNVLGFPSTHIPTSFCNGLPVGFQCVANANQDRLTMAVAVELEKVFGGWKSPAAILDA